MNSVQKRILIIDDEEDINLTVRSILENKGFKVDSFSNPMFALENFVPGLYDLLILDIKMPQMDGFQLYRKIRDIDGKIEVCFMTASEEHYEDFIELFPIWNAKNNFLSKPISASVLVEYVREMTTNKTY